MNGVLSRLKGFYERLREANRRGVLLPAWRSITGETPSVSFQTLVEFYLRDPTVRATVDFLADQTVGMGFHTTAKVQRAKAVIDEFNESVNLDGLLMRATREMVAFGNSFWEKIEPDRLETLRILPITSIEKILRNRYGEVQGYKQTIRYDGSSLDPDRIIHFRWTPIDSEAFGTGILRSLTESMDLGDGKKRPSFMAMKGGMEKSMTEIVKKYAGPTEIWKFPGLADDKAISTSNPPCISRHCFAAFKKPASSSTCKTCIGASSVRSTTTSDNDSTVDSTN